VQLETRTPGALDAIDAAVLPLVLLTGAQVIEVGIQPRPGETILITGAIGGVGRTAVHVAKLGHCSSRQLLLACIQGAEGSLDRLLQYRGWFTTALRLQTVPVKRVVPCLRCIIEDSVLISFAGCRGDDILQRKVRKLRSCHQLV